MNVPKVSRRALCDGMSTLISNAWSAISTVVLDAIRNSDTVTLTPMFYGTVSSSGAPSAENGDKPLDHAIILDTEEDISTKLAIVCGKCGTELEVMEIREIPEEAVILEIEICDNCKSAAFSEGYRQNDNDNEGRGY